MLFFLFIAFIRITFHTFLSPLYNSLPHRGPGCPTALLPSSSLTSPFYVCSYIAPLAILLSVAGFCLSCFHFSLIFSIYLDHQTSQVFYFPTLLMDDDLIYSIPSFFPELSYQQSPPSLKFFFANHVDIATVPIHHIYLKGSLHRQGPLINAQLSNCSSLETSQGITTKFNEIRHSLPGNKGRSHRHWCIPRHQDCKARCIFILRFPALMCYMF